MSRTALAKSSSWARGVQGVYKRGGRRKHQTEVHPEQHGLLDIWETTTGLVQFHDQYGADLQAAGVVMEGVQGGGPRRGPRRGSKEGSQEGFKEGGPMRQPASGEGVSGLN